MSTYLVAMVVGEFDYIEDVTSDGIKVRVYTPVGKQEQGQFALEVAVKVLPYYKEYFKMPYPLPKMDLIAIGSFSAGENHICLRNGVLEVRDVPKFCGASFPRLLK